MAKGNKAKPPQVPAQNSEVVSNKKILTKMLANLDPNNTLFETQVSQLINRHIPYITKGQHQQTLTAVCDSLKSQGCKLAKLNVIQAKFYEELAREFRKIAEEHSSKAKALGVTKPTQALAAPKNQTVPVQQPAKQIVGPGPSALSGPIAQNHGVSWPATNIMPAAPGTQIHTPFSWPFQEPQAAGFNYAQQLPQYHNQYSFGAPLAGFQGLGAGVKSVFNSFGGQVPQSAESNLSGQMIGTFNNNSSNQESAPATKKSKSASLQSIRSIMTHSEMSVKGIIDLQESSMANANPGNERAYFLNSLEVAVLRAYIHQHGRISDLLRVSLRPSLAASLPNNVVRRPAAKILHDVENILQKWYSDGALQITTGALSNEA